MLLYSFKFYFKQKNVLAIKALGKKMNNKEYTGEKGHSRRDDVEIYEVGEVKQDCSKITRLVE